MVFDSAPVAPVFPDGELDARVEIKLGDSWVDISYPYVYENSTSIQRGHPDESTTAAASAFAGTLDNSDGRFSSLYPLGPYYGLLGLNTPIRASVPEGATYLRLEGDSLSGFSAPAAGGNAALATGLDVQVDLTPDNWYTGQIIAGQYHVTGNLRSFCFMVTSGGFLQFQLSTDGTQPNTVVAVSPAALTVNPHARLCVRVVWNASTQTVTFYTAPGATLGGSPTWTQIGQVTGFTPASMFTSATPAPYSVGCLTASNDLGAFTGLNGKVHAARIQTLSSTTVAQIDFTGMSAGATSYTDAQGNSWSVFGTAEVSDRKYRFHGEVAAWPQSWSPGGNNAKVAFAAGGLLRRLGRSNIAVQSPMFRAYSRISSTAGLQAYWSCEDGTAATQLASGIGGPAITFGSALPTMASFTDFVCSQALPVTANGAYWTGLVPAYTVAPYGTGHGADAVVRFLMAVPSGGETNGATIASVYYAGATLARVDLVYGTGGSLNLSGFNAAGTQIWTSGPVGFNVNGGLLRVSIDIQATSASTYQAVLTTLAAGASVGGTFTAASGVTDSVGRVTKIVINPPGGGSLTNTAIGHISVQSTWTTLFDMSGALAAYAGEAAGIRFQRLCVEEGIAFRGMGNMNDTSAMGIQTLETVTQLLQECADTDQGMWFEPRQCLGFGYRTRVSLGNQLAAFSLDYNQDHVADDLSPTMDDQNVFNDVTVTAQNSGSSSRQVLDDGSPLSVSDPPVGAGRYDTQVTLNVSDDSQLDSQAGWKLHTSTVNEPRYTAINVDLANRALASLYYAVLDADIGDRATVSNPPFWLPPGLVDQIILGCNETVSRKALYESYNGRPSTPWNVAYADDVIYGRADTDGSALASAVSPTATTLPVVTTTKGSPGWTTNSADLPFDIEVGGERMTVTGVGTSTVPDCRVGATLNNSAMGASDFNGANSVWSSLTGHTVPVTRVYLAQSDFTYSTNMQQMVAAGVKMCISFRPAYNPVSPTDLANMQTLLQTLQAAGAHCDIDLWAEPFYNGLSIAQFDAVVKYYGSTIRKYYPLVFCTAAWSAQFDGEVNYYTGSEWFDKLATDWYCDHWTGGCILDYTPNLDPGKPFGIWEMGSSTDPTASQTSTQVSGYISYTTSFFQARTAAGLLNADVIWFNSGGHNLLAAQDSTFESGTLRYTGSNATVAIAATGANTGTNSMSLTATAAGNMSASLPSAQYQTVTPGTTYMAAASFKAASAARSVQAGINWRTSTGTFISSTFAASVSDNTTGEVQSSVAGVAPANAARAQVVLQVLSAATGEVHYVDDVMFMPQSGGVTMIGTDFGSSPASDYRIPYYQGLITNFDSSSFPQAMTVTRSVNGVLKGQSAGADVRLFTPSIISL